MDIGSLAGNTAKYDIPVSHLDYSYIDQCTDTKYLEKILKVLRTGQEGKYPALESHAEKKLESLNPKSRVLRKESPIQKITDLPSSQQKEIMEDIDSWAAGMKSGDHGDDLLVTNGDGGDIATNGTEFPVRSSTVITSSQDSSKPKKSSENSDRKTAKRVKPRDYREWDKIDVDAELNKLEEEEKKEGETKKAATIPPRGNTSLSRKIQGEGMSEREREIRAEREKEKGNEAFRAGDHAEAEIYYTRSLSLIPSIAARNNRAQAYLKLSQWDKAVSDTNEVLRVDHNNIKAHLRRGVAFKGKSLYIEAKQDLEKVLDAEPNNKRAKEVMSQVEASLAEQKTKGRRMMIEESDGSDEEEEESIEIVEPARNRENHINGEVKEAEPTIPPSESVDKTDGNAQVRPANEKPEVPESKSSGTGNTDEGLGSENGTAEIVNTKSAEQNSKASEEQTKESADAPENGEEVTETEQPPAVEPAPPLPDEVLRLKDEGIELFKSGRYAEARDVFNKAVLSIQNDTGHAENLCVLYSNRAACKEKTGDLKGCVEDCDKALTLNPHALKPTLRRAHAQEGREKYREAYVDYRKALHLCPSSEVARQGSSRCQSILQTLEGPSWREKLPSTQLPVPRSLPSQTVPTTSTKVKQPEVKVKQPLSKDVMFEEQKNLGNDFVKKGDFKSAVGCYTKCVEVCPDRSVGYTNRALCYLRTNQAESALSDCKEASKLDPGNVKALFRQGQAYKMLKDYELSELKLRQVMSLDTHNSAAKRELQVVLRYREEENLKKKAPRKKIVIEESSSEEEDTEKPQGKNTTQTTRVPQDKSQAMPSVQNVPTKDNVHKTPADISAHPSQPIRDTTSLYQKDSTRNTSSATEDERFKEAWEKLQNKQEVKAGAVHSGKAGSTKQEVKSDIKNPGKKESTKSEKQKVKPDAMQTGKTGNTKQEVKADEVNSGKTGSTKQEVTDDVKHAAKPENAKQEVKSDAEYAGKTGSGDVKYDLKVPKASSKIRPTAQTTPKMSKASGFEFMTSWTSLKSPDNITPYMELLLQVKPDKLPSVISNKLEGEMLPVIGRCAGRLAEEGKSSDGFAYLQSLTKVPRFEMNTMFMSEADKKELRSVFTKFKNLKDASFSQTDVDSLKKKFGL